MSRARKLTRWCAESMPPGWSCRSSVSPPGRHTRRVGSNPSTPGWNPCGPDARMTGCSFRSTWCGRLANRFCCPGWTILNPASGAGGLTMGASGLPWHTLHCGGLSSAGVFEPMRRVELPAIATVPGKYAAGALTAAVSTVLYVVPNRWQIVPPRYLPLTWLDNAIPFWPVSGLAYGAIYLFLLGTFIAIRDLAVVSRFVYACLFTQITAAACFVVWPTVYPRELYPVSGEAGHVGVAIAQMLRGMDTPANCLPSLHVSTAVLCAVALRASQRSTWGILCALPLALSTLTFKQHYVIDVLAGLALGLLAYFLFFRWRGFGLSSPVAPGTRHANPEAIPGQPADRGGARDESRYCVETATAAPTTGRSE